MAGPGTTGPNIQERHCFYEREKRGRFDGFVQDRRGRPGNLHLSSPGRGGIEGTLVHPLSASIGPRVSKPEVSRRYWTCIYLLQCLLTIVSTAHPITVERKQFTQ